jgi:hypothetical protein
MSVASDIAFAKRIVSVMDLRFSVFGIKFGIDPLLDIIPELGNGLALGVSFYLFWIAYRLNVPTHVYFRMLWNIGVDYVFGVVPYIGIVMDLFFRANVKNLALIEKYHDPSILVGELVET